MNDRHWFGFSRTVISVAVAMAAAPVLAQNTTSAVGGRVADASGRPVAGATVTIRHEESGSTNTTTSDAEGRYAVRGLRVGGPYTVTFTKDGQTDKREGVFLALAETTTLDGAIGAATSTVVVTGQATGGSRFSSANMGAGTAIGSRELNSLASIQRNLQDYARVDPRLSQTDKDRGEISALGQNSRFNSITIDGVTTNDTFGLESNNLPTAKQPISIDAIQSVQINVSNYDVTQKGYTGANINAVTKSGTNEFHGSLYYVYRDEDLAGDRYNRNTNTYLAAPAFKEDTKGFTLGGPIIKDKIFFFVNYEELKSSRASPEFGPIGSSQINMGITPTAISGLQSIAKNTWGIDIGGSDVPSGSNLVVKDTTLKLDWNISDDHRASIRYNKTEQTEPQFSTFSNRLLSLSSFWFNQNKSIETLVGQWFADWSPTFSTELKLSRRDYESEPINNSRLPLMAFDFGGTDPTGSVGTQERTLSAGTERSRHFNQLFTKTNDAYLGATWTLGRHEVKFGGDISQNEIFNAFLQDTYGQYKFQCESGFTYTFGSINCATASTAQIEAAVLENFQRGRPSAYQAQLPLAGKTILDGAALWKHNNYGLFLQDTFKVSDKLTVSLGGRMDMTDMPDKPLANTAAAAPVVAGNAATSTRQSGGFGLDNTVTPDGESLFQPRLGFNWNLGTKERRMQLRGGLGLFEGAAMTVWLSNPYSNNGRAVAFYGCGPGAELTSGTGTRPACGNIFSPNPDTQPVLGTNPAPNIDFLSSNLRQPSLWKANLAFDTELPWFGLTAGAEWVHTKVKSALYYQNLNLGPVVRSGTDGRELYYNTNGYNRNCWTAAGVTSATATGCGGNPAPRSLSNSAFGNVTLASGTKEGGGDTLTLSLSQQPWRDFSWSLAYTYSDAKEVSPLTSSVALSNFNARSIFNPNEEVAANSAYLVKDRFSGAVSWSKAFFRTYRTSLGLFYEGRRGKPYSWTFNNDLNGDGVAGNDLMYIPSAPGSGEVVFNGGAAEEARFWEYVNAHSELSGSRGTVVSRNGSYSPWVNTFDLRLSQEVPGILSGHKGVFVLDFLNVGNMINKRWGRTDEVAFQSGGGAARSFVNYKGLDANGRYIYSMMSVPEDLTTRQTKGESQWAVQVTLKYEF
jgi:hypothetical protein